MVSTKYKTINPRTNKIKIGRSITIVFLKIAKKIPTSAGPIKAPAFQKVLKITKNSPAFSAGINFANRLLELP